MEEEEEQGREEITPAGLESRPNKNETFSGSRIPFRMASLRAAGSILASIKRIVVEFRSKGRKEKVFVHNLDSISKSRGKEES